jgi:hypothetical protein
MDKYIIAFFVCIFIITLSFIGLSNLPEPYKLHNDGGNCSIGKPEILGDYKVLPDNKNPLNFGDAQRCANRDCIEYNNYQKLIKSNSTRCKL